MSQDTVSGLRSKLPYLVVLLGCLVFLVLGFHREPRVFHSRDFKQPYASARCVLKHCDPYSEQDTEAQFVAAHGPDNDPLVFVPYSALYPPPSLLVLSPVAALPYPVAHTVWLLLIGVLFSIAALLIADLCTLHGVFYGTIWPVIALAVMLCFSDNLLMLGQISGVAISLLAIGLWLVMRERPVASAICIALAVCLKPHDVIFFLPYFLIAGRSWRRSLGWTLAICIVITMVALGWFAASPATAHWLSGIQASLAGNSGPGSVNDPAPTNASADAISNLQTIYSVVRNSKPFYSAASYLTTLLLCIGWLYAALRMRASRTQHLLSIACLACITLMPIYHRQYDTRLLILIFPAIALLFSLRQYGWAVLALVLSLMNVVPPLLRVFAHLGHGTTVAQNGVLRYLVAFRPTQLANLGLAVVFVAAFVSLSHADRRARLADEV